MKSIALRHGVEAGARQLLPDIQILRGAAVLAVIAYHFELGFVGGYLGVDVFFVISGFVITKRLFERSRRGDLSYREFFLRRAQRLLPALVATIALTSVFGVFLLSPLGQQQQSASTGLASLLGVANFQLALSGLNYFSPDAASNALTNLWSLSVEEQFYLFLPIALVLVSLFKWHGSLRNRWIWLYALMAVTSFSIYMTFNVLEVSFSSRVLQATMGFYSPLPRAWQFAVGGLVALVALEMPNMPRRRSVAIRASMWVLLIGSFLLADSDSVGTEPSIFTVGSCFAAAALLALQSGLRGSSNGARLLVGIGDRSYSLYLLHWPAWILLASVVPGGLVRSVVALALTFAISEGVYRFVENPVRYWRPPTSRPILLTLAAAWLAGLLSLLLLWSVRPILQNVDQFRNGISQSAYVDVPNNCFGEQPLMAQAPENCWIVQPAGDTRSTYLIGDSFGAHLLSGIEASSHAGGLWVYTKSGCFPILERLSAFGRANEWTNGCQDYGQSVLEALTNSEPGTVLLGIAPAYWADSDARIGNRPFVDAVAPTLISFVKQLRSAGHQVVIAQPPPGLTPVAAQSLSTCPTYRIVTSACASSFPVDDGVANQLEARRTLWQVSHESGADLLEVDKVLCPRGSCVVSLPSQWADDAHLSEFGSRQLAQTLSQLFKNQQYKALNG